MSSISSSPRRPGEPATDPRAPVLSAELSVNYPGRPGVLRHVAIEVYAGEIVGLVGQSGSGKSTFAHAILRLLDHTGATISGRTLLLGQDVTRASQRQLRKLRGRSVSFIPQSPVAALNPALRIGTHLREAWVAHSRERWPDQEPRVMKLLASAGLPASPEFLRRFPREVSVGQAQRVLIVMALLHSPALIVADEPTSAVDVITQKEVLALIVGMSNEGTSVLLISHDLPAVAGVCQRLAILHEGAIIECGPVAQVLASPAHSYTRQLVAAVPKWP
ncbi:MAG TPA: ABC transporter ATP-binding protein [Bryobacteraceae bacterium]|nr:ABC transporter ATP-binding protein [Bryobacteraceae bacterium]